MNQLELMEAIELKIGLCSEQKLEPLLQKVLCPVLLKLASPEEKVRNKVVEICMHINKRITSPSFKLPAEKLLNTLHETDSALVRKFCVIYIQKAFENLDDAETKVLVPLLIKNYHRLSIELQTTIFGVFLRLLPSLKFDQNLHDDYLGFKKNHENFKVILEHFTYVMLYYVQSKGLRSNARDGVQDNRVSPLEYLPCNLSIEIVGLITDNLKANFVHDQDFLKKSKLAILNLLSNEFITAKNDALEEKYILFMIGTVDASGEVHFLADSCLKRLEKPSMENENIVQKLVKLYMGTKGENVEPSKVRSFGLAPVKLKVIDALTKSDFACSSVTYILEIVTDATYRSKDKKLNMAGILLLQRTIKLGNKEKLETYGSKILKGLISLILKDPSNQDEAFRGRAFEATGMMVVRLPDMIMEYPEIFSILFKSFITEERNICPFVQDALISMIPACKLLISQAKDTIDAEKFFIIVLINMGLKNHYARYTIAKYLNALYPFKDPNARFLSIICVSDEKLEIIEQGYENIEIRVNRGELPSIHEIVNSAHTIGSKLKYDYRGKEDMIANIPVKSYSVLLRFMRQILIKKLCPNAIITSLREDFDSKSDALDVDSRMQFKIGFQKLWPDEGVKSLIKCCKTVFESKAGTGVVQAIAARTILDILSMGPLSLANEIATDIDWYYQFIVSKKAETRYAIARIVGILAAVGSNAISRFDEMLKRYEDSVDIDEKHGYLLTCSYIMSRSAFHSPEEFGKAFDEGRSKLLLGRIESLIDSKSPETAIGAILCFGELGRFAPIEKELQKGCMEKLYGVIKSTKEVKVQEAAIVCMGHFLVANPSNEPLEFLLGLPKELPTQVELYFTIGEALCAALFGFSSNSLEEYNDVPETKMLEILNCPLAEDSVHQNLKTILNSLGPGQSAVARKAAAVWILCITKYCSKNDIVNRMLKDFHDSSSSLLGDKDEFTQEIASKCVGMIYECADPILKKELVEGLVATFTVGKKIAAQSVSRETELFSTNVLGSTPEGNDITTYQSILSLAAEMNQPDLVYKFMNLASHHAIWNSKRGASMGFASIATQAEKELEKYLPSIVPKLFRYQFDPHPKTAMGMKSIWKSLVKDQKVVDILFKEIMDEILKGMTDSMWRTRESSSTALADIMRGRKLEQLEPYMDNMWNLTFRCLDDIKQSVRTATLQTAKTLANITTRFCDPMYFEPSRSQSLMDRMVPLLLKQGLVSATEEVQQFALATILKLCKTSGVMLKPHVVDIICTLLESLSSMESQMLNYLSFHSESYSISQNDLDNSRLAAAKTSPTMEAIQECVPQLDSAMMDSFVPRFCSIIKKGVGLPTRAGCARLVYILVLKVSSDLKPHADSILKALAVAIEDNNPTLRKSFSTALGYLIKLCSEDEVSKFGMKLKEKYLAASTEDQRSVAPVTFLEISRNSQNIAQDLHAIIIPLAFMGSRDSNHPSLAAIWGKVWDENTGGTANAIKNWNSELIDDCKLILQGNPSWTMKKQVGKALTDISKTMKNGIIPSLPQLLELLSEALKGRTWDGKEAVLEAFAVAVSEGESYFANNPKDKALAEDIMIREAQKSNPVYRRLAIEYLGLVFNALNSDRFNEVIETLTAAATSAEDEMDLDEDIQKPFRSAVQASAFKSIGNCFPTAFSSQGIKVLKVQFVDGILEMMGKSLASEIWNVRIGILEGLVIIFDKLDGKITVSDTSFVGLLKGCLVCLSDGKYRAVKDLTLSFLQKISTRPELKSGNCQELINGEYLNYFHSEIDPRAKEAIKSLCTPFIQK